MLIAYIIISYVVMLITIRFFFKSYDDGDNYAAGAAFILSPISLIVLGLVSICVLVGRLVTWK